MKMDSVRRANRPQAGIKRHHQSPRQPHKFRCARHGHAWVTLYLCQRIDRCQVPIRQHHRPRPTGADLTLVRDNAIFISGQSAKYAVSTEKRCPLPVFRPVPYPRGRPRFRRRNLAAKDPCSGRQALAERSAHLADLAAFALATGLRRANVTGLEWTQVDLERRVA